MSNDNPQGSTFLDKAMAAWENNDTEVVTCIAREALAAADPGIVWVRFALFCRDKGNAILARGILEDIIRSQPATEAAYYELAFLHRLQGDHHEARRRLDVAAKLPNASFRTHLFLAHMLHVLGAHPEANAILEKAPVETPSDRHEIDVMFEFGRYVAAYPLGRSLVLLDELKERHAWLGAAEISERVKSALRSRTPFTLIRLGDGEGGVLRTGKHDEHSFRSLYERNRDELISMWFGPSFDWRNNGFIDTAQGVLENIASCDIIGIPYEGWLRHEYDIASLRGIPSLVNVYRALLQNDKPAGLCLCNQNIHMELHKGGYLAEILSMASEVSVISCLPEVATLLESRFQLRRVTFYQIPGEHGSKALLGAGVTYEAHYPEAFARLQQKLSRRLDGHLFLVAGGLLGKLYAITIRQNGGIALDLGSLVDAWVGRSTRPGYDRSLKL